VDRLWQCRDLRWRPEVVQGGEREPLASRRQRLFDGSVKLFAAMPFIAASVTCCWLSVTGPVFAAGSVDDASRATARKLGYSGVEAYQAGDYQTANEKLQKA